MGPTNEITDDVEVLVEKPVGVKELILNSEYLSIVRNNPSRLWEVLHKEPMAEWLTLKKSETTGQYYQTMNIETLEFLLETFFEPYYDCRVRGQYVKGRNQGAAIVTLVEIKFTERGTGKEHRKSGSASVFVRDNFYYPTDGGKRKFIPELYNNVKRSITLEEYFTSGSPLSLSEARKNAIKNICPLFGRNLNRDNDIIFPEEPLLGEKREPDEVVKAKYAAALEAGDEKVIKQMESIFNFGIN